MLDFIELIHSWFQVKDSGPSTARNVQHPNMMHMHAQNERGIALIEGKRVLPDFNCLAFIAEQQEFGSI